MDPREFPTKGNLILAKNSLALARQGYDLMDKKRNILIRELMDLIDEAKDIQKQIDTTFTESLRMSSASKNIEHGISRYRSWHLRYRLKNRFRSRREASWEPRFLM